MRYNTPYKYNMNIFQTRTRNYFKVCFVFIYIYTRLLGRFAPIFYLNCEHVLFCVHFKTKKKKISRIFKKNFKIFIIHKPSLGLRDVPQKFGPDRLSRFDVYWIQTNKQTDKPNLYIDIYI